MGFSSEIDMAINIGRAIYQPDMYESKQLLPVLAKLDIDLSKWPLSDRALSKDLRVLCRHEGDVSLEKFMREYYPQIQTDVYIKSMIKCFFRGILYLYPGGSFESLIRYANCDFLPFKKVSQIPEIIDNM